MEPVDKDTLQQPPRDVKDMILSRALILKILLSASVIISGTLFIFWKEVRKALAGSILQCLGVRRIRGWAYGKQGGRSLLGQAGWGA